MADQMYGIYAGELSGYFDYDVETGNLVWAKTLNKFMRQGKIAGSITKTGITIGIHGNVVPAPRVVWALINGYWPDGSIRRKNKNKYDNRIENLYEVAYKSSGPRRRGKTEYRDYKLIPNVEIKACFDLVDGRLVWKKNVGTRAKAGSDAGIVLAGVRVVGFKRLLIPADEIIYALENNSWKTT